VETTLYNIAGYRFDDWSLVKELYVPADASSSTKTLKDRSRSGLVAHLQYYAVPNGKLFIAFRATRIELTTTATIGIFGTSGRYGRYPESHKSTGEPKDWDVNYGQYWRGSGWGTLVLHGARVYECKQTHDSDENREPGTPGGNAYWNTGGLWVLDWEDDKNYFKNEIVLVEISGVLGSYMCTQYHLSDIETNKPCIGDWASYWNTGDEFIANIAISRQNLNISKGITLPFGIDIIGVFSGNTAGGRWIGAKTNSGTMKAGATLWGIEVDA